MLERVATIQKIADIAEPKVAEAFKRVVSQIRSDLQLAAIERALKQGGIAAAIKEIPLDLMTRSLQPEVAKILREVAEAAAQTAPLPSGTQIAFDITSPEVFKYLQTEALNELLNIRQESEAAIRVWMQKGFAEGIHPYDIARGIREYVGLTSNQLQTVDRFRQFWEQVQSGDSSALTKEAAYKLQRAGLPRSAGVIARRGLTSSRLSDIVSRYADKLLRERAIGIARTLTIDASNAGQNALWKQAAKSGLLNENEWEVRWIVAHDDRLCPRCLAMAKMKRPLYGVYPNGVARPTLHPQCRCSEGLVRKTGGLIFRKAA